MTSFIEEEAPVYCCCCYVVFKLTSFRWFTVPNIRLCKEKIYRKTYE